MAPEQPSHPPFLNTRGHVFLRMTSMRDRRPKTCSRKREAWHPERQCHPPPPIRIKFTLTPQRIRYMLGLLYLFAPGVAARGCAPGALLAGRRHHMNEEAMGGQ